MEKATEHKICQIIVLVLFIGSTQGIDMFPYVWVIPVVLFIILIGSLFYVPEK